MRIGILTQYYNTRNYGGILQAFALTEYLRKNGFDAEQICYDLDLKPFTPVKKRPDVIVTRLNLYKRIIRSIKYRYKYYLKEPLEKSFYERYKKKYLGVRYNKFLDFQKIISHSDRVYTSKNIYDVLPDYDCFIVGSDQVWNFDWFSPVFFLEFADDSKKKIAYAVSAGKSEFNKGEMDYLKKVLPTFDAISVREEDLVSAYKMAADGISPKFVVDPVFLLDIDDWNKVSNDRLINDKYIFSFFLGNDDETKHLAHKYAKKKNLKLVTIPFCIQFNNMDITYGDRRMHIAGPKDFISLIRYAECVFTDSFHATAFSIIFKKDFRVFERKNAGAMSSRIESITKLAGCEASFCDSDKKRTMKYLLNKKCNYLSEKSLRELQKESKTFLLSSIIGSR